MLLTFACQFYILILSKLCYEFSSLSRHFESPMYMILPSAKTREDLISSCPICVHFIFHDYYLLLKLIGLYSVIRVTVYLLEWFQTIVERFPAFPLLSMILVMCLAYTTWWCLGMFLSCSLCFRFIAKVCSVFSNAFSVSTEVHTCFFFFILLMWCIT